jgi:hypothetical protein
VCQCSTLCASQQASLGLEAHPSVQGFNVDLAWDGSLQTLQQTIQRNRNSLDFPALADSLGNRMQPNSLLSQAMINRLVKLKVALYSHWTLLDH